MAGLNRAANGLQKSRRERTSGEQLCKERAAGFRGPFLAA
jgi:hypothetical protein